MTRHLFVAARTLLLFTLVCGLLYPMALTAFAALLPGRSHGSVVVDSRGQVVGSALLGQNVTDPGLFWSRPSASDTSGETSGGSNLGPASARLAEQVREREQALRAANPEATGPVPPDALTASSSGLDPHISAAYARWQAPRVARATGVPLSDVLTLVDTHTERAFLGFLGQDRVNVLELNVALREQTGR